MSIKFLHYRKFGPQLQKDGTTLIRALPHFGATVAYAIGENGISYATAYCGANDNYSKYAGRAKASGRLNSLKYVNTASDTDGKEFIRRMDEEMSEVNGYYRDKAQATAELSDLSHDYFGG